jgi:hypothetical protein
MFSVFGVFSRLVTENRMLHVPNGKRCCCSLQGGIPLLNDRSSRSIIALARTIMSTIIRVMFEQLKEKLFSSPPTVGEKKFMMERFYG